MSNKPKLKSKSDGPSNQNEIEKYLHCALCIKEWYERNEAGETLPPWWSRIEVGYTKRGWQVWCARHNCNIIHFDFEGCKHPANMTRRATDKEMDRPPLETKKENEVNYDKWDKVLYEMLGKIDNMVAMLTANQPPDGLSSIEAHYYWTGIAGYLERTAANVRAELPDARYRDASRLENE